jgi:hypothetical protein
MDRVTWTDERLDDQAQHIDAGFARVDRGIRDLRAEMRSEFAALRSIVIRGGGGIMAGLLGVIAAVLSHGA